MPRDGVLYKNIVNYFTDLIKSGQLEVDERIMTEYGIMDHFSVSRITAIRALKELQQTGLVYRVKGKGSFVAGTEFNNKSKSHLIGLVVAYSGLLDPDFLTGIEGVIKKSGYFLTIHNTENSYKNEREIITRLEKDAAGMILYIQPNEEVNLDIFSKLVINKTPVVIMDSMFEEYEMPYISSNNKQAFYNLTQHVIDCGHQNIGYVASDTKNYYSTLCRYKGYCSALIDNKIPLKTENIYNNFIISDELREKSENEIFEHIKAAGVKAIDYFLSLKEPPTAIMAVNDSTAIQIMYAAIHRGLRVPDDISITGFDNLKETRFLPTKLTTVMQDFKALGEQAGRLVLNQIMGSYLLENRHEVDAKLIIGDSVLKRQ